MALSFEALKRLLSYEVFFACERYLGVESVADFAFCFKDVAEVRTYFGPANGWVPHYADQVGRVWALARQSAEGNLTDAEATREIEAHLRRIQQPARQPVEPSLEIPPKIPVVSSRARSVLPLDLSSKGAASISAKRARGEPEVDEAREAVIRIIQDAFDALGRRGSLWVENLSVAARHALVVRATASFDTPALKRHLGVLRKFRTFSEEIEAKEYYMAPSVASILAFLQSGDARGATVAKNYYFGLNWWEVHLGFPFQCSHRAVALYSKAKAGHVTKQVEVLSVELFLGIVRVLLWVARKSPMGAIAQVLRGALLFLASSTRHIHFRRSSLIDLSERYATFRCGKGKRRVAGQRPGFDWSVCRNVIPGLDIFGSLFALLDQLAAANPGWSRCPQPDVATLRGEPLRNTDPFRPVSMAYGKFQRILQGILVAADLKVSNPRGLTTYAFRRFCITVGETLRYHPEDLDSIGNWLEKISTGDAGTRRATFAMRNHYAASKAESAADARAVTFLACLDARRVLGRRDIGHSDVACMRERVEDLWASLHRASPQAEPVPLEDDLGTDLEEIALEPEVPNDSESEESDDSFSDVDALVADEPAPSLDVCWFLQRSKIHLCWAAEEFRTICDGLTFVRPPLAWGSGIDEAKAAEGSLCERCLDKYLSAASRD